MRVTAFSNGHEYMMWREINCDICTKDCPIDDQGNCEDPLCDIEGAIAIASIGDGKISKEVAVRARLPFVGGVVEKCSEYEVKP